MKALMGSLQALGRALMLPIAVLPVAALLLRLGQPDLLDMAFVSAAGGAMFSNLGLLFAIGVATGLARDGNGAAPLAGVVCYLVATEGAKALLPLPLELGQNLATAFKAAVEAGWRHDQIDRISVPLGIASGIVAGIAYNRFSGFKPPEYLAFFGGRRFVPIVSGLAGLLLAVLVGISLSEVNSIVNAASERVLASGEAGLFVYGVLNRLLVITGLHHILNNIAWFVLGDFGGTSGDLRRFFAGDPTAGLFMSGFFPVMMFGLPAACLAMYRAARPERRKETAGMLLSLAATSFLTGVTEPIEFTFMFLAPVLFLFHAVMTGIAMAIMAQLNVHLGFGFSAGLLDYILNFNKATRPLVLLPVGVAYAVIYYGVFSFAIRRFDLQTPGRGDEAPVRLAEVADTRGAAFLAALGGAGNLDEVGACTTRLRLLIKDQARVDEAKLRALGAKGVIRPSSHTMQVVLGPLADLVAVEIREASAMEAADAHPPSPAADKTHGEAIGASRIDPDRVPPAFLAAIGGAASAQRARAIHGRLLLPEGARPNAAALQAAGARGMLQLDQGGWHVLIEPAELESWLVR